jgi:hypothetical protein
MNERKPPPWSDDPLSQFFAQAEFNDRVTAINLQPVYELLTKVDAVFRRVEEATGHNGGNALLIPNLF